RAGIVGNVLRVNIDDMEVGRVELDPYGNIITEKKDNLLQSMTFMQKDVAISGAYRANNGPLTADVRHKFDNSGHKLEIYANFPGELGFCGGFYSPLALFFDDTFMKTTFRNVTKFKLNDQASSFYWPTKEDPVYFLALDKNNDGKINNGSELFGETENMENGFLALAVYDKNKDQIIDHKDPVFKKLLLWKDKNANGKSEPGELMPLKKKKVHFLSLKYSDEEEFTFGNRAKAKERSYFSYTNSKGKVRKGDFFDIWLSPNSNWKLAEASDR
ncbi:MAG: hypothetical protein MJK18_08060, partial [Bdellovibrionales bacterium]|nr:hypothetical protein [Bdellovibrionales bacterium]